MTRARVEATGTDGRWWLGVVPIGDDSRYQNATDAGAAAVADIATQIHADGQDEAEVNWRGSVIR